jgi:hypothetical protein
LRADLLVNTQRPPLTLEAAMAIAAAQRGDFVEVGGKITGVAIEGLTPLFGAAVWPIDRLVPLGALPAEQFTTGEEAARQVFGVLQIEPRWARSRYFFVSAP